MTMEITIRPGVITLVDDADYVFLMQWKWTVNPKGYVNRCVHLGKDDNGKFRKTTLMMHRLLMSPSPHLQVDHIDGNPLNNQKSNLRICTNSQNQMNSKSRKSSTSKYRGVSWNTKLKKWVAQIQHKNIKTTIGFYRNEESAALAYNEIAKSLFGKFARLNENILV